MKAVVIGASGLVGGALLRALDRSGVAAVGTSFSRSLGGTLKLDVRDQGQVQACLGPLQPDVVFLAVNLAGGVDFGEDHREEAEALNLQGTGNVAEVLARSGSLLVYYSTDYIFDGKAGPYPEDATPNPINLYGRNKWEAERIIQGLTSRYLFLRTTAVFGWDRASRNVAMQLWGRLQASKPMPVANDQWCNPTLVDYLAEVSVRLVQMEAQGTFNVVGKDWMPRSELAQALARAMALDPNLILPVPTSELGQRAARPLRGGLRTEKLAQLLGTEPMDLSESLKRFRRQWRADTHVTYHPKAVSGEAEQLRQEILERVRRYYQVIHKPRGFLPYKTRAGSSGGTHRKADVPPAGLAWPPKLSA